MRENKGKRIEESVEDFRDTSNVDICISPVKCQAERELVLA